MLNIIADTREQHPFTFTGWDDARTVRKALDVGDYSLVGQTGKIAIERKTLIDVTNCLDGKEGARFRREMERARDIERFFVVVEGSFAQMTSRQYRCRLKPNEATAALVDLQLEYGRPFIWAGNRRAAEYLTYWILKRYAEQENVRPETDR